LTERNVLLTALATFVVLVISVAAVYSLLEPNPQGETQPQGTLGMIAISNAVTSNTSGFYFQGVQIAYPAVSVRAVYIVNGMPAARYDSTNMSSIKVHPGDYRIEAFPPSGYAVKENFLLAVVKAGQIVTIVFFLDPTQ
jgi:hypothetical protein